MTPMPSAPWELRKTLDDSLVVRHISTKMDTCRAISKRSRFGPTWRNATST